MTRKTFMVREEYRIGKMRDGGPYVSERIGGGTQYAIQLFDASIDLEGDIFAALGIKNKDKIEVVMTVRKIGG